MAKPAKIVDVLSELMSRRGFARVQSAALCESAWQQAAGELMARHTRVGEIKRNVLEITVAHSALAQELTFQKAAILTRLASLLPDETIKDLRCRVGAIE